ncbi:MobA/MobL family protein [Mesorhizobium sp. B4-1-4]|uniref:MobA/MobL family protein n=1 Tax=Mesorhizobium sp. B4-1-4 TaxID=2589888 RepID=UPI00112DB73D|nr:MobA/MobL family protein [Mesorhizobium sp. B4-1-4]UCI29444.1 MobA/MobL family protein [Mesorhizobium sp. B4-1-4]
MADFFRVQLGVVSRSDGHSAAKRSAYQSCGRAVDHEGRSFDFSRKRKEHVRTIMLVPDHAPNWAHDPEALWQRAAAVERRIDAQEARIVDFSMPRQIPEALWEPCIRHVYGPFVERGMIFQIDIHDVAASDGGRNINIHGLATLRSIDGDDISARKDRSWNDLFRERNGRNVRELFAAQLTAFCQQHGFSYDGDARPNSERDLPDPEPRLPRWNFGFFERTSEMPEALAALQDHRRRRREWEAAQAEEIEAALELRHLETRVGAQRQRQIVPANPGQRSSSKKDRRAAILRTWHRSGWIDAEAIPSIASVRFDEKRDLLWINLADGTALIDRGDAISLKGRITWTAAAETAAAAERHGWESVEVHGDQAYKDAVTVACMLRGIEVRNHVLSPKAQAAFDRLRADQSNRSTNPNEPGSGATGAAKADVSPALPTSASRLSSREIHLALTKRITVPNPPPMESPDTESSAPVFKPAFPRRQPPKKLPSDRRQPGFDKAH